MWGLVASDQVLSEFLFFWMQTVRLGDWVQMAIPSVNNKLPAKLRVALPPIPEQRRIVDLVESIDVYIDALEAQVETTRTARSALLAELLPS